MKIAFAKFLSFTLPAFFVVAAAKADVKVLNLMADHGGWKSWTQRPELAPEFRLEQPSKPGDGVRLFIDSRGDAKTIGCWVHALPTLKQGRRYRIETEFESHDVPRIGYSVWAIVSQGEQADFDELDHDGITEGLHRMRIEITPEKDYAGLALRLFLAQAPRGSVRWVNARLIDVTDEPVKNRTAKLAAVGGRPANQCTAEEALKFYLERLDAVGAEGVDLVCLPETINDERIARKTGVKLSEQIPGGPFVTAFAQKARQYRMYVAVSLVERDGDHLHNTGVLIDRSGNIVGKYRKTHPTMNERFLKGITPGDTYPVFNTDIGRVGYMICYDNHQPEVARALALNGAEIIVFSNNSDGREGGTLWESYMRTRALDNQVHIVASVNRPGQTCIVTPRGEILSPAGKTPGELSIANCDIALSARNGTGRTIQDRYLRVRRSDTFAPLLRDYAEPVPRAPRDSQ